MHGRFRYLNVGLGVILAYVGAKMLATELYHPPSWFSLAVIAAVLTVSIAASVRTDRRDAAAGHPRLAEEVSEP